MNLLASVLRLFGLEDFTGLDFETSDVWLNFVFRCLSLFNNISSICELKVKSDISKESKT